MQTYTHLLITAAISRPLERRGLSVHTSAFLIGAVLPDLPFGLLTLVYWPYYLWIEPIAPEQTVMSVMEYMHFDLFYSDPVWIVGHNFLQAPLILGALGLLGWALRRRWRWGPALLWIVVGAGLHALIDIVTHHSDGPLLLFPFDWTSRFASPISYWEPGYYAWLLAPLEHLLDLALLIYLGRIWWRARRADG